MGVRGAELFLLALRPLRPVAEEEGVEEGTEIDVGAGLRTERREERERERLRGDWRGVEEVCGAGSGSRIEM